MKSFQDLNLCDDFLFKEVMRDEKLLIGFLEMVLDLKGKIKRIKIIDSEKTIKNGYLEKSIILDVYGEDEEDNVYNVEIQNHKLIVIPKRSRMYQSKLDGKALKPGEDYDKLKEQIIIFICTGDPFGLGLYKYTFENRCLEEPSIRLGDVTKKIFLNTKGRRGEVSRELKAFLDFVERSTVENAKEINDPYVTELSAKIEAIKKDEELGGVFMTLEEKMNELAKMKMEEGFEEGKKAGLEEGIKEGIKEGIREGIKEGHLKGIEEASKEIAVSMKQEGFTIQQIMKLTKLSKEEIESL